MCIGVFACMGVCAPHECSTQGDQQGAFHPVDLEVQMAVRHHVGVKNWTLSLVEKLSMPLTTEPSQWCLLMRRLFKSIYLYFLLELVLPACLRSQEVFTLTANCLLSRRLCLGQSVLQLCVVWRLKHRYLPTQVTIQNILCSRINLMILFKHFCFLEQLNSFISKSKWQLLECHLVRIFYCLKTTRPDIQLSSKGACCRA